MDKLMGPLTAHAGYLTGRAAPHLHPQACLRCQGTARSWDLDYLLWINQPLGQWWVYNLHWAESKEKVDEVKAGMLWGQGRI